MAVLEQIRFNVWTVTSLDPSVAFELRGQFQPDGAEIEGSPVLSEGTSAGSAAPTVQWVAGGRQSVRVSSEFRSLHQADDIRDRLAVLDALDKRDTTLGRAPRVAFQWGELLIEGFAVVKRRHLGWWSISGLPKGVSFDLEIVGQPALELDAGPADVGETQHLALGASETFETLGRRYLGDPLRGELIRRINPRHAAGETPGARVRVFERTHPAMRGTVRPTSPGFLGVQSSGGAAAQVLEALAADRGTVTPGTTWDRLPEVRAGEV